VPWWRRIPDLAMRRAGARRHLSFLVETARAVDARLVHSHFGDYGWRNLGAVSATGMKHLVTFYGIDVVFIPRSDPRWGARYRELFDRVDRVLCEGPHMASCIVELGCPPEKVSVHHLGIDMDLLPFQPAVWQPGQPLRVLMAGSFREKKGFPYAIDALGAIRDEVELEVTLIGDAHDERTGREKRAILDAIERNRLGDVVRLPGYQPYESVLEDARRHHVFLSPSVTGSDGDTEGGAPVSIIEMCASGLMVVSTTHCDIPGVVLDGVTGLLARERDTDALADRLRWLLSHPDDWHGMLTAARKHIEAEFDARVQGERLGEIYRRTLG
jgi:colanic acid/amylovoran biosynthesis glycosyltransferase